jgi:cell division protein FtsI (penicillin-binding protein 3)
VALNFKNEVLLRVYIVMIVIVVVAVTILTKAFKLIAVEGEFWRKEAAKKYMSYRDVTGSRGNILSEDGSLMATSIPYFDLYWDAATPNLSDDIFKKDIDSLAYNIAYYIAPQTTPGAWKEYLWRCRYETKSRYTLIAKGLTFDQMQWAKTFPIFRLGKYKGGLVVMQDDKRSHPFKMLALRTLGYVKDDEGKLLKVGLEGKFNKELVGNTKKVLMQNISETKDMWMPVNDLSDATSPSATDLVTTIDINIQDITQNALIRSLNAYQAEHGTAIVMEVKTGKIKAIANVGLTKDGWWEDFNYGIGRPIEPGSTWKLASMMALLEDQAVKLSDTIDIEYGKTKYFNETLEDAERLNVQTATVKQVFAHSSNVGISKMVYQTYKDKPAAYIKHIHDFMLHVPTNIEIEGELPPYIKNPDNPNDNWSGTTLPWMSIGYELQVTPLQLLTFYNAVANDGVMMKPYLVKELRQYGKTIKRYQDNIIKKRLASKATIEQLKELLEAVVEDNLGTARHLRTPQYRFAGKTGTAQLNYEKLSKTKQKIGGYQASFAGYFPAENPVYSCMVVVHKPKWGIFGGVVAAPVFREIADKLIASNIALSEPINLHGKPVPSPATLPDDVGYIDDIVKSMTAFKLKYEVHNTQEDWVYLRPKSDTVNVYTRNMLTRKQVPSVVGMGLKDALYVLENRGLRVRFSGYGKVVSQSLSPGAPTAGQVIAIRLE